MDPLTHALAGSAAARVAWSRHLAGAALLPGVLGALLPDVDALIRSEADPLLYAQYHRHFTHSLAFIPIGGMVASLPWLAARRSRARWPLYFGAASVGYATHGLLDASTTYGTLLFWPFSDARVAWNAIAIVDPLFTLVLLAGLAGAVWRRSAGPAGVALIACVLLLTAGVIQRDRASRIQEQLAERRGHASVRGAVFPGFGTNIIWRSLYQTPDDTLHMDRLRLPWFGDPSVRDGPRAMLVRAARLPEHVRADARRLRDFRRFQWFTGQWVAWAPFEEGLIGDARYSESPDRFEPVWGIRFPRGATPAVEWVDRSRGRRLDVRTLWNEVRGIDPRYQSLRGYKRR